MHNFVSIVLVQAVKSATINVEPMCVTLGNKLKVLSAMLAKYFVCLWDCINVLVPFVPNLSALIILEMDLLT